MKTSEKLWFYYVFVEYRKRPVAWNGLIKSSKLANYHSGRNSVWEFLKDSAGVWGVLSRLSNICDLASLWKC